MYWAKQRADAPLLTAVLATEQLGIVSVARLRWAALASVVIPAGVMSGEPMIFWATRLSCTVPWPWKPRATAATPNAIRTTAATSPPISSVLRIVMLLLRLEACSGSFRVEEQLRRSRRAIHRGSDSLLLRARRLQRPYLPAAAERSLRPLHVPSGPWWGGGFRPRGLLPLGGPRPRSPESAQARSRPRRRA